MPRQRILTSAEQATFDNPPKLTPVERKKYFFISSAVADLLSSLRTPTNKIGFVLQLGYFRATFRFFSNHYYPNDVVYVSQRIDVLPSSFTISCYDEATVRRHRKLILEYMGFHPFDRCARHRVEQQIQPLIRSQIRPRLLFQEAISCLQNHKIQIPASGTVTMLILEAIRRHRSELIERIQTALPDQSKVALDNLFEKDSSSSENLQVQRSRLTLLKRFSHSTRPSKIKSNLADLQIIRELYQPIASVIHSLDLTSEGLRYFAHSVIKSEVFQVSRRSEPDRYLHLLCFITHQYYHLHDLLMDALLIAVQNTLNTCKREHKDQYYDKRGKRNKAIRSLVENVENVACNPLTHIEKIVFEDHLVDSEKVRRVQDILQQHQVQYEALQEQISQVKKGLQKNVEEEAYYEMLEKKSIKLQNKVGELVRQVPFQGNDDAVLEAVRYYQKRKGIITHTAPVAFLSNEEKQLLTKPKGKFRVSLYKPLLFIKTSDAVKSGTMNVEESYRYRSLDDYLIPKDKWDRQREDYLKQADLTDFSDFSEIIQKMATELDQQYTTTNQHILEEKNEYVTFRKDGSFRIRTPKKEKPNAESLSSFFPEDRYISLLEVLSTVNQHSQFLDAFQHWQVKYTKERPPERMFFAGIIGFGCQVGTGKVAKISRQISNSELERTINWHFSRDNIAEANDKILILMDKLQLPQRYRRNQDQLHTSSDGQKVEIGVESLNANHSFKYFGQGKGASTYTFLDERNLLFHTIIVSPQKETAYVIDGLMHNDVVKSDIHSTDTGGYTELLFGAMRPLKFCYAPRIKNIHKQKIYSFRRRKEYENLGYRILPDGYINRNLIEENWDDILRFIATIKLKVSSASQLFKRLNSYSRQHPLYSALKEFGKIEKSLFILKWIDSLELRQAVEKQLNKGEHTNRFANAICFSRNQEFQYAEKVEQEMAAGCNQLIRNAIICWNYLYLSKLLTDETDTEQKRMILEAFENGSIAIWQHLNLHGEYDFSEEKLRDSVGFNLSKILEADF